MMMNKPNQSNSQSSMNVQLTHNLASRRSAFSPYRQPSTVLTNLQRGNIQTQTSNELPIRNVHQLAALGELFLCNLEQSLVDEVDDKGFTPLLWAAAYGQLASLNLLIENGANIHYKGPMGENALHLASASGHTHIVKVLLSLEVDVNETDEDGNSALMYAAYGDFKSCAKELLENGADVTLTNSNLDTVYSITVKRKCKEVQSLLEKKLLDLLS